MGALIVVLEDNKRSAAQLARELDRDGKRNAATAVLNYLREVLSGLGKARLTTQVASAFAAGYVDCDESAAVDGTDELAIGGSVGATLAVEAAPANQNQFLKGESDSEFATNLAGAINAHTTLSKLVRAYAVVARCHIVALVPGLSGNLITLAETGDGFTLSAAALSGGASDEADHFEHGYAPTGTV